MKQERLKKEKEEAEKKRKAAEKAQAEALAKAKAAPQVNSILYCRRNFGELRGKLSFPGKFTGKLKFFRGISREI